MTRAFIRVAIAVLSLTGFAALSGSLAWAKVTVSPTKLSFGRVQVNKSKSMSVAVTGVGAKTHVTLSVGGPFTAKPTSFDIKPGVKKQVTVTFRPTKVDTFKNTLHVNSNLVSLTGDSFAPCNEETGNPPCYFIAIRLVDQFIPASSKAQPVADDLENHLKKLKKYTSPKDVFVYKKSDIHISLQVLELTSPMSSADEGRLKTAMTAVRAENKSLNICGPIMSGNFEVWPGNIVYHMTENGRLTGLMQSVIKNLDAQGLPHSKRQDFPKKGHYSVGSYKSGLRSYLDMHFKPFAGKEDTKSVHYMKHPSCQTFVPASLSLMIRLKNPPDVPNFQKHYHRDASYQL